MILHQGKLKLYIFEQIKNYIVVVSPKGQFYLVPIASGIPMKCSCPGFTYNNKCKHMTFTLSMDLQDTESIDDPTLIGPWTEVLYNYAQNYKDHADKAAWYEANRIPRP